MFFRRAHLYVSSGAHYHTETSIKQFLSKAPFLIWGRKAKRKRANINNRIYATRYKHTIYTFWFGAVVLKKSFFSVHLKKRVGLWHTGACKQVFHIGTLIRNAGLAAAERLAERTIQAKSGFASVTCELAAYTVIIFSSLPPTTPGRGDCWLLELLFSWQPGVPPRLIRALPEYRARSYCPGNAPGTSQPPSWVSAKRTEPLPPPFAASLPPLLRTTFRFQRRHFRPGSKAFPPSPPAPLVVPYYPRAGRNGSGKQHERYFFLLSSCHNRRMEVGMCAWPMFFLTKPFLKTAFQVALCSCSEVLLVGRKSHSLQEYAMPTHLKTKGSNPLLARRK